MMVLPILAGAACHSMEWAEQDPVHGLRWRDRVAFVLGPDVVLARSAYSAADALQSIGDLRAKLQSELGQKLPPTLWILMGQEEDALAAEVSQILTVLDPSAHSNAAGRHRQMELGTSSTSQGGRSARAPTPEEQQRLVKLLGRSLTAPVNLATTELHLPPAILARVDAAVLYPTNAGLEAVASDSLDILLALQELSIVESATLLLARGTVVDELAKKLVVQRQRSLVNWIADGEAYQGDDRDTLLVALARALGLSTPRPQAPEPSLAEFLAAPTTVFPDASDLPAISWADPAPTVDLGARIGTHVLVMANTFFDAFEGRAPGKVVLMREGSVSRADIDNLLERLRGQPGRVLVSASTQELAATVALLHAVRHHKLSPEAARDLWVSYGMPRTSDLSSFGLR